MAGKPAAVKLQLLLSGAGRDAARHAELERQLRSLGIELTAKGATSAAARTDPETFSRLFSSAPHSAGELPLPESLREFVQSITTAPDHDYF